ncbi:MAG: ATP-binding protein [Actinomycetes bacterium]
MPKRDVAIARGFLAQRLSVINADGTSTGQRAAPEYVKALKLSDEILATAPEGLLPERLHEGLQVKVGDFIDQMLAQSRKMVVDYQQELDLHIRLASENRSHKTIINLWLLFILVLLTSIFLISGGISFMSQYRAASNSLNQEAAALSIAVKRLESAEITVKTLEDLNANKNDFISTVNHELRTPLTSIIGYIDLLRTIGPTDSTGQFEKITHVIERNSSVLLDLVGSILSLSNLDSPEQISEHEKVFLADIIKKKIFILSPQTDEKSITFDLHIADDKEFVILGNSDQISQVVLNLLSNAVKFSPEGSHVDITLSTFTKEAEDDSVRLEIKDQGIGIPAEDIPKLFKRFSRAKNAVASQIEGTGLGLAIVARILELHNAKISVESVVNQGSTFTIDFPRFLTEADRLISRNRLSVLHKAINALKASTHEELISASHQMGGAVAFYNLEKENELILQFHDWLEATPLANFDEVHDMKKTLINTLERSYEALVKQGEKQ